MIIPRDELDLDWFLSFSELGHRFQGTFLDGHPAVLVQLKTINSSPETVEVSD
jgi:hypothetical protein